MYCDQCSEPRPVGPYKPCGSNPPLMLQCDGSTADGTAEKLLPIWFSIFFSVRLVVNLENQYRHLWTYLCACLSVGYQLWRNIAINPVSPFGTRWVPGVGIVYAYTHRVS